MDELRQAATNAETAVEAAVQTETNCRVVLDRISRSAELDELLSRQSVVEAAQERLTDAQSQAEQIQVTDESLLRIRQATEATDQANARLRVAATRISFHIPGDRLAGIEVEGAPLTAPPSMVEAVEPVVIAIPERGRILVEPAVADRDQLLRAEREARAELHAALSEVGVQSLADAQVLRDQRRDLEAAATAAKQELERLTPPDGELTLQPRIDELRQLLATVLPEGEMDQLLQRDVAEAALQSAQSELRKARDEERLAYEAVNVRAQAVSDLSVEARTLENTVDSQAELIERRRERLSIDAEAVSDEQHAAATDEAAQSVTEQRQTVSTLEEDWSASARAQLESRISRLDKVIAQRASSRVDAKIETVRLRERVEAHDSAGIDEAIEHTQHELERATRQRDRLSRELDILDLLSDTLRAAESEARERYLAPVVDRVHPYLQMLFPNAEIGMDEDLNITGMSRRAGYEESFDHLSMGTQEQIAVLVRLAFAEMLVAQGAPAAVILDDALVFSDDQRMRLMFDILSHAAKRVQIVVFTCREQLFEGLGAHQLRLASGDPESLRSA